MPRIILEHVTKKFDSFTAVSDLNLVIEDREFITLLGPSGCGKTTTLRMIAGLETPSEGRITIGDAVVFDSEESINVSAAKRDVGFLFQNYALWPHMTVYQNIAFGLENLKWPKEKINERVDEMLQMMKITEFVKRYPSELSGGQQQRVAIARTLAPRPKVLFMDEPLSNLDAKLRLEMRSELKRLHVDTDSTFVYVTHDQLEAMTLATRVCLMNEGVLQQYAPPLELYHKPVNLFAADFVGNPTMNFLRCKVTKRGEREFDLPLFSRSMKFIAHEDVGNWEEDVVIGVRPEFVALHTGTLKGHVYTTLPAGMETTVKLEVCDVIITSVIFGGGDYKYGEELEFSLTGDEILMYSASSGNLIAEGRLE